ncbi:DUF2806 domain-containing protein [Sinorhizobium meliloti]|uniref:DUF2806 domain-containing protein n=1 Tax=Rhizobium meliloti TaxID=382 RepID=UPI0013E3FDA9|nr:DUF2806 domain-containing protein [Sinorhizobium meliloti]
MSDDHLDNEIAVAAELTDRGVKANARSRTLSALDRLLGSVIDWPNTFVEGDTAIRRARIEGERKVIEALADRALAMIATDDDFARRAIANQFGDAARKHFNKGAVAALALEDLKSSPPNEIEAATGPSELEFEFMDRFQRYAEDASTDELRERWGRVLASEIRKPGTFSRKVMRVVDEIDREVAAEFEKFCAHQISDGSVVRHFAGELDFGLRMLLVDAGLLVDPGDVGGQCDMFGRDEAGETEMFALTMGEWAVGIDAPFEPARSALLVQNQGGIGLRVYVLSPAGQALSKILPHKREDVQIRLMYALRDEFGDKFHAFRRAGDGFREVRFAYVTHSS